jgi:hypothetical protein
MGGGATFGSDVVFQGGIQGGIEVTGGATFSNDIKVNDLTVGKGGGDVATNTAVGYQALEDNTEGTSNVASGRYALHSNTTGSNNVASGYSALYNNTEGDYNVASGYQALYRNTEGDGNVATGTQALFTNTEGHDNVASGYQALYNNTYGDYNVASGYHALYSNTGGDYNVASGYKALYSNTVGDKNVASGIGALESNTEGGYNVASGYHALYNNTVGDANVASGNGALNNNTEGSYNVASGIRALYSNTVGDNNSALGYNAGFNGTTGSNNTYIGYNAQPSFATASNEIVLGDSNVTLIHSAAGMSMGGGATFDAGVNIYPATTARPGAYNGLSIYADSTQNDGKQIAIHGASDTNKTLFIGYNTTDDYAGIRSINSGSGATPLHLHGSELFIDCGISADAGATFGADVVFQGDISAAGATIGGYWAGVQEETIGVSVNNGSSVLTTGVKGHRTIPYACDIVDWRVTSTESVEGEIDWGINYCTYANFPTMTAVTQSNHTEITQLVSGDSNKAESAGGMDKQWDKYQFDAGDIIEFEIDSVTTLTNCILELTIRRTS